MNQTAQATQLPDNGSRQEQVPTLPQPLNLFQRLNNVRARVHYIRKEKRVGEGGYLAVTHDAVTALVREHLIREGVMLVPSIVSSSVTPTGTNTAKGIPFIRYEARFRFTIVNVDNPQECVVFDLESHAIDQGDKAPGKAISYATKYAYLKLLSIESGEDEEEREQQKAPSPTSGVKEMLEPEQREHCEEVAAKILDLMNADQAAKAAPLFYDNKLETEEKVYVWTFLNRQQKKAIKEAWDALQKASGK